jgi:hypothetical protein
MLPAFSESGLTLNFDVFGLQRKKGKTKIFSIFFFSTGYLKDIYQRFWKNTFSLVFLFLCLSVSLSLCLSVSLSLCLSVFLSLCLSVCFSAFSLFSLCLSHYKFFISLNFTSSSLFSSLFSLCLII